MFPRARSEWAICSRHSIPAALPQSYLKPQPRTWPTAVKEMAQFQMQTPQRAGDNLHRLRLKTLCVIRHERNHVHGSQNRPLWFAAAESPFEKRTYLIRHWRVASDKPQTSRRWTSNCSITASIGLHGTTSSRTPFSRSTNQALKIAGLPSGSHMRRLHLPSSLAVTTVDSCSESGQWHCSVLSRR